ncbi:MAG: helix-turn-helix domain-containing protein, partial [Dehalococcoidia bacterium]|nr:helix-turn-helix domain-containing protein [Dehalococcoidia bacterium]
MEDQIYAYHAEMCQVLSHPKRLEVIDTLRDGEITVTELAQKLQVTSGKLSVQLSMMTELLGLLTRNVGIMVYYRIAN